MARAAATILAAVVVAVPALAAAYRNGPPPAHSGGFGEPTCHACHFDGPLNEAGGSLTVRGFPESYEPGATYDLEVILTRPGLRAAGMQLAIRFLDGEHQGRNAGTLLPVTPGLVINEHADTGVRYIQHDTSGIRPAAPDTGRWTLRWTAPSGGAVVLNVAANAANDDNSEFGDNIYVKAFRGRVSGKSSEGNGDAGPCPNPCPTPEIL